MEKAKAKMKIKRKRAKDEENNEGETRKIPKKRDHVDKSKEKEDKRRRKKKEVVVAKVVEEKGRKRNNKNNNNCLTSSSQASSSKKLASLGVFDFPWLKDGVMSKTEECCSFLDYCGEESFLFSSSFSDASTMANVVPQDKLIMEDLWQPFESDDGLKPNLDASNDDLDCIWTSLLNNPL
ncbi:hypothetical protein PIB30_032047 [Stylosanthes scabra]|uniref:Uncharacterized protein n=1 Tax=Stylosanthes scabra TaxID=79078 RepID=A0ABU6YB21_9FABA|nr:hypothetical protein [Stylosanthes scabra]